MNATALQALLQDALLTLEAAREELRDLDAAIGDGDLGITVSEGARAARAALSELPADAGIADILRSAARSFAAANPSTMAALVASALLAAAQAVGAQTAELDRRACVSALQAATEAIQRRGGAEPGDKTIVDALLPTLAVLRSEAVNASAVLAAMIAAAQEAVTATTPLQSRRGRAAWVAERTIGHPDGGATAYLRLLQAIQRARQHTSASLGRGIDA